MIKSEEAILNFIKGINIIGGVRAYMDSYNDYNSPLLEEMYKAKKLNKQHDKI